MQKVSEKYRKQMDKMLRNRGHIHVTLEIVNQKAQNNATVINDQCNIAYFSTPKADDLFHDDIEPQYYATDELDFTKVDGSMFFAPEEGSRLDFLDDGIVTRDFDSAVCVTFHGFGDFDIKGLTIDFSEFYPTRFQVVTDNDTNTYDNDSSRFVTDDVFRGVSFIKVIPLSMLNGSRRMRIVAFKCGVTNEFSDTKVITSDITDYASPIADSIPSRDMNITIDNKDRFYTPDNSDNEIAFMEVGQKIRVKHGYDLDEQGSETEWVTNEVAFLSSWSADTSKAQFTATDRFDVLSNGTYHLGKYRAGGITLHDLAVDVLADAGLRDSRDYVLDDSLDDIVVYNPIPPCKHSEALQMIANMARCTLLSSRKGQIQIQKAVVEDMPTLSASSNGETLDSDLAGVIHYGYMPKVEGSAYYSMSSYSAKCVLHVPNELASVVEHTLVAADSSGWSVDLNTLIALGATVTTTSYDWDVGRPVVTITPESPCSIYNLAIHFMSGLGFEFIVRTFDADDVLIREEFYATDSPSFNTLDEFLNFSKMEIEFVKIVGGGRVEIDDISFADVTGILIDSSNMRTSPLATRQNKLAYVSTARTMFTASNETKELSKGNVRVSSTNNKVDVYFSNASYDYSVSTTTSGISVSITDSSDYYVELTFSGMSAETAVDYVISGKEYVLSYINERKTYSQYGEEIVWSNPLVSTVEQARTLNEWLGAYYDDELIYDASWRGDPRLDVADLIDMETTYVDNVLARIVQNSISYNGAFSGSFQARKVV